MENSAKIFLMPREYFTNICTQGDPPVYKYNDSENWNTSLSQKLIDVISPINNQVIGRIQSVTHSEASTAIQKLKIGQKKWQETPLAKRKKILNLAADWIRHHEHYLTTLLTKEIGKCHEEAKDEILQSADMIDSFSQSAFDIHGEEFSGEKTVIVEKAPLGIVLAISPFTYPVNHAIAKIVPALIMGNGVVFKPSIQGSISALHLTVIFRMAGLPHGVLTTLTGGGEDLDEYLFMHKDINFTGPLQSKRMNPAIILPDADMEETAKEIVKGAFSYSGQSCSAIKYVLSFNSVIDKILPYILRELKNLFKMGDPRIHHNNLGPLIDEKTAIEVEKKILLAKVAGVQIVTGGKKEGLYIEPTIIDYARPSMEVIHEETYGPVLSFIRVKSMEEALVIVNESKYGLQASIFTSDEGVGIALARKIEAGTVLINSRPQAGIGVHEIRYMLEAMVKPKVTVLNRR